MDPANYSELLLRTGEDETIQVTTIGLDIAKNVFRIHGVDAKGRVVLGKRLRRSQVTDFFANVPVSVVGMECTRGAHFWASVLATFGHTVRLIAPQFVEPYLKHGCNGGIATVISWACSSGFLSTPGLLLPRAGIRCRAASRIKTI